VRLDIRLPLICILTSWLAACATMPPVNTQSNISPESVQSAPIATQAQRAGFGSEQFFIDFAQRMGEQSGSDIGAYLSMESMSRYLEETGRIKKLRFVYGERWLSVPYESIQKWFNIHVGKSQWRYLQSERQGTITAAVFRLDTDSGVIYCKLDWYNRDGKIVDLQPLIYDYSVMQTATELAALIERWQELPNLSHQLRLFFRATTDRDGQKIAYIYQDFAEVVRNDPLIRELLMKVLSLENLTHSDMVVWEIEKMLKKSPYSRPNLTHYYYYKKDYPHLLEAWTHLPDYVLKDAGMLSEIAAIHSEQGALDKANDYVYQAIRQDPYYNLSYFVQLSLALKQNDHPLASLVLRVLQDRFDIQLDEQQLLQFEGGDRFLASQSASIDTLYR
jgi:tetratricopeptide (TPR) repeat protein